MQEDKNTSKMILYILAKCVLYIIMTIIILIIVAILSIKIIYLYEENKFIDNCIKEGDTQEHCQSIWSEVDSLN